MEAADTLYTSKLGRAGVYDGTQEERTDGRLIGANESSV